MEHDFEDERTIELSSIQAIFPELVLDPSDPYTATLELPVTPLTPVRIQFSQPSADAASTQLLTPPTSEDPSQDGKQQLEVNGRDEIETHELEHLPSLKLGIQLHENYPAEEPPEVTLVVTPPWLSRATLESLIIDCTRLWEKMGRDQVVFSYIDHLQQQAEAAFRLTQNDHPVPMRSDIKLALLDYDFKTRRKIFEQGTFDCGICLEPKKGNHCHRLLSCRHVFCVSCLQDFYNSCISEGDVDNVKCLDPGCGKEPTVSGQPAKKRRRQDKTLNPSELLQIPIEQEQVQRYVHLKRKKRLESDQNTIYCPRQWCQGAARSKKHPKPQGALDDFSDSESEAEVQQPVVNIKKTKPEDIPASQRLAVCEDCNFAFCIVCRKGWHGEMTLCNPRKQKELDAEEQASIDYLQRYSTPCPTCNAPAQKTMGCNHMICFKCKTHFCYLCSAFLMPDNPYKHFNNFKSTCYMRLWELEGGDGEGAGNEFYGVGGRGLGWEEEFDAEEAQEAEQPVEGADQAQEIDMRQLAIDAAGDSEDEEPAPDIRRRERAIEFVNFARGNEAHRIILPDEPEPEPVPLPAPVAAILPRPRGERRRQARQGNAHGPIGQRRPLYNGQPLRQPPLLPPAAAAQQQIRVQQQQQRRAAVLEARLIPGVEAINAGLPDEDRPPILPRAAPGQGRADGHQPAIARAMGIERFLELAANDREDERDSDELDDDDDDDDEEGNEDAMVDMGRIERGQRRLLGMNRGIGRGMGAL